MKVVVSISALFRIVCWVIVLSVVAFALGLGGAAGQGDTTPAVAADDSACLANSSVELDKEGEVQ